MNQNSKQTHKNVCFLQKLMPKIRSKNVLIEMSHMDKMLLLEGTYNDVFLSAVRKMIASTSSFDRNRSTS